MRGIVVPMGSGIPAVTHQNLKILGIAGYRIPGKSHKLGTGYRENFRIWVPMGTGYQPENFFGTDEYSVPAKYSMMLTWLSS